MTAEIRDIPQTLADQLGCTRNELIDYLQLNIFPKGAFSADAVMELCRICIENKLSPFAGHVYAMTRMNRAKGGQSVTIGIKTSGWTKILNDQQSYDGMEVLFSNTTTSWCGHTVPEFLTVKIYKKNQRFPFCEIFRFVEWAQANNPVWKQQPLAMFQKRVMASAVRDCYGLGVMIEEEEEIATATEETSSMVVNNNATATAEPTANSVLSTPAVNTENVAPAPAPQPHSKNYDVIANKVKSINNPVLVPKMKEWLGEKLKQKHINQAEYQELTETIDRMFAPVGEPAPQYDEYQQQIDENVNYMNVA